MRSIGVLLSCLMLPGCAWVLQPELQPSDFASEVAGPGRGAAAAHDGVVVAAHVDAWPEPEPAASELDAALFPMLIRVENGGTRPLTIAYGAFQLEGTPFRGGDAYPLAPAQRSGAPTPGSAFTASVFRPAPGVSAGNPQSAEASIGSDVRSGGADPDALRPIGDPSDEMIRLALPEGVLDPGGEVSGFLYFPPVRTTLAHFQLRMDLIDAATGVGFGTRLIPFTVHSELPFAAAG